MIKFFRKIRQNMINENKTGKYLKYAIGEIILVVIGILIALSINNWNEQRKMNSQEQELLEGLEIEFTINHDRLERVIQLQQKSNESANKIMTYFNKDIIDSYTITKIVIVLIYSRIIFLREIKYTAICI